MTRHGAVRRDPIFRVCARDVFRRDVTDLTSKKAVGTAAGFVGFFGYVGRVIQGKGLGWIAQHYGWNAGLWCVLGCTFIAMMLLTFLWNVRPKG